MKIRLILVLVVLGALGVFTVASALDDDSPETPSEPCCCNGETDGCTCDCDDCDAVHSDGDDCDCDHHHEHHCGRCY